MLKTVLNPKEISTIIDTFNSAKPVDDFCVVVEYKDIEDKKLSFSAGHYFDVKIEYSEITQEEFEEKMIGFKSRLESMFDEGKELEDEIKKVLRSLSYE